MANQQNNYQLLIAKLDQFIRKFYVNQLIRGGLYSIGLILLLFIAINTLEHFFYFDTGVRKGLFYSFVGVSLLALGGWVVMPLLKYFNLGKVISHEQAAEVIGDHFGNVKDKLLNVLQLKNQAEKSDNAELILASINQKTEQIKLVPFRSAIDLTNNKKYLRYALPPLLLLLVMLIAAPSVITDSSNRLINNDTKFERPAPFHFIINADELSVVQFGDYTLDVEVEGEALPNEVYIDIDNYKYRLTKQEAGKFSYQFSNVQKNTDFKLFSSGVESEDYTLGVLAKPNILGFDVKLDYPAYTQRTDEELANIGDLVVPQGTNIDWVFNAQHTDNLKIQFSGDDASTAATRFSDKLFTHKKRALKDEQYKLFISNELLPNADSISYRITVIPDQYPTIRAEKFVDSLNNKLLFFVGDAADDYGLLGLSFNYRINNESGQQGELVTVKMKKPDAKQTQYNYTWDLNDLELKPGDEVTYYFEVFDNDAVNGSKSAKTNMMLFAMPTLEELEAQAEQNNEDIKDNLEKSLKESKKVQQEMKKVRDEILQKKELNWQDKKELEKLLERQKELEKMIEEAKKDFEENLKNQENNRPNEQLQQKQEQLQKKFDELMTDEMKELMQKMEELLQKMDKEDALQMMEDMEMSEKQMEKNLEQLEELFKQLEMEYEMQQQIDKLNKLAEEQEKLAEETEKMDEEASQEESKNEEASQEENSEEGEQKESDQKEGEEKSDEQKEGENKEGEQQDSDQKDGEQKDGNQQQGDKKEGEKKSQEQLQKEQKEIQEKFEELQKKAEELEKKNQEMEMPMQMEDQEEQMEDIQQDMQQSQQQMQKKQNKKASKSQKKAAQKMKQMASQMQQSMQSGEMEQMEEDMAALRQLLENLVGLSFNQEELIEEVRKNTINTPKYVEDVQRQYKLKDDFELIEDSLQELSKRVFQIESFVTEKVTEINTNMKKSLKQLEDRKKPQAADRQQRTMKNVNDLALMLSEVMDQMQQQMSSMMSGNQMCSKPGGKSGKSGKIPMDKISQGQKQMNSQMQQMKEAMEKMQGDKGQAKQFAQMAAKQAALRKALREAKQKMQEEGRGKDAQGLQEIMDAMDKVETDLVNKRLTNEMMKRQEQILSRLLEAEKAEREREFDNKRKAESAAQKERKMPPSLEKYIKQREAEIELYKSVSPALRPYYKILVEEYFKELKAE
ncbi:MAG: DUF4175 family protein [Bacteroidota bacterium]